MSITLALIRQVKIEPSYFVLFKKKQIEALYLDNHLLADKPTVCCEFTEANGLNETVS